MERVWIGRNVRIICRMTTPLSLRTTTQGSEKFISDTASSFHQRTRPFAQLTNKNPNRREHADFSRPTFAACAVMLAAERCKAISKKPDRLEVLRATGVSDVRCLPCSSLPRALFIQHSSRSPSRSDDLSWLSHRPNTHTDARTDALTDRQGTHTQTNTHARTHTHTHTHTERDAHRRTHNWPVENPKPEIPIISNSLNP